MKRWQPVVIVACAAAAALVVAQALTQGAPQPRPAAGRPGARPPPPGPGAAAPDEGLATPAAEPWAKEEEQLLGERTFSHPVAVPAPALRVEAPDGRSTSLTPVHGQAMLVSFWATWCPPCVAELPSLLALSRTLREAHPGRFRVVAVSGDDSWEAVNAFFARTPGGAPAFLEQVRDPDGSAARAFYCAARGYCPDVKYPETYLVDGAGRIRAMMVGPRDWSTPEARQLVESILDRG